MNGEREKSLFDCENKLASRTTPAEGLVTNYSATRSVAYQRFICQSRWARALSHWLWKQARKQNNNRGTKDIYYLCYTLSNSLGNKDTFRRTITIITSFDLAPPLASRKRNAGALLSCCGAQSEFSLGRYSSSIQTHFVFPLLMYTFFILVISPFPLVMHCFILSHKERPLPVYSQVTN